MNEQLEVTKRYKYAFMRDDGNFITIGGNNPEDAWETLCESMNDDSLYIKRFFDLFANNKALDKGFEWLNNWINRNPGKEFGPVFKRLS